VRGLADIEWTTIISLLISVGGIIISVLVQNKIRKEDAKDFERELQVEREKLLKHEEELELKKLPNPILSFDRTDVHKFEGANHILITTEINNQGTENLTLKSAVLFIDRPNKSPSGSYNFEKVSDPMFLRHLLEIKNNIPPLLMEKINGGDYSLVPSESKDLITDSFLGLTDFYCIEVLQEYMAETGHRIAHDEKLKSEKLYRVKKPGFYRINLIIHPDHPKLDSFYHITKIVFVPPDYY
jgi:hypothetical protein